jgi:hypothetical protein
MSDNRTLEYLMRVNAALRKPDNEIITVTACMECGEVLGVNMDSANHWVLWDSARMEEVVVIGCEGYQQIQPSLVGLPDEQWCGTSGVNVA